MNFNVDQCQNWRTLAFTHKLAGVGAGQGGVTAIMEMQRHFTETAPTATRARSEQREAEHGRTEEVKMKQQQNIIVSLSHRFLVLMLAPTSLTSIYLYSWFPVHTQQPSGQQTYTCETVSTVESCY